MASIATESNEYIVYNCDSKMHTIHGQMMSVVNYIIRTVK